MILDILTPGDWQDSYESRFVSFGNEVRCLQDVLNVLKCEFENGKHNSVVDGKPLFVYYDLIIYDNDYNRLAHWDFYPGTMEVEVIPPIKIVHMKDGQIGYTEPFGRQRYRIPIYYPERVYKSN